MLMLFFPVWAVIVLIVLVTGQTGGDERRYWIDHLLGSRRLRQAGCEQDVPWLWVAAKWRGAAGEPVDVEGRPFDAWLPCHRWVVMLLQVGGYSAKGGGYSANLCWLPC